MRGIPFQFTFQQWSEWWMTNNCRAVVARRGSSRWAERATASPSPAINEFFTDASPCGHAAVNLETSAQNLGEQAIDMLFEAHRLNRIA